MKNLFEKVIRETGGAARLPEKDGVCMALSVQPLTVSGDGRDEQGTGFLHRYRFFAPADSGGARIAERDALEYAGERYRVEWVETHYFRGEAVYRSGILIREECA